MGFWPFSTIRYLREGNARLRNELRLANAELDIARNEIALERAKRQHRPRAHFVERNHAIRHGRAA